MLLLGDCFLFHVVMVLFPCKSSFLFQLNGTLFALDMGSYCVMGVVEWWSHLLMKMFLHQKWFYTNMEQMYHHCMRYYQLPGKEDHPHKRRGFHLFQKTDTDRSVKSSVLITVAGTRMVQCVRGCGQNRIEVKRMSCFCDRLVGLVVKASASRAEGPGFKSCSRLDFFGIESYQWLKNWHSSGYPARRLAL